MDLVSFAIWRHTGSTTDYWQSNFALESIFVCRFWLLSCQVTHPQVIRTDTGEEQQLKFVSYKNALRELNSDSNTDSESEGEGEQKVVL